MGRTLHSSEKRGEVQESLHLLVTCPVFSPITTLEMISCKRFALTNLKTHQRKIYKLFISQNRPIRRCLKIYFALCNPFSNTINVFYVERINKFAIIFNSSNMGLVNSASHHNYYEHYGLIEYRYSA